MNTLLDLGSCIIAAEHIVKAEFVPARKGGEPFFNEDTNETELTTPRAARMDLTLTSIHQASECWDYSNFVAAGGSASDHVLLHGEIAEKLAIWLQGRSEIIDLSTVDERLEQ